MQFDKVSIVVPAYNEEDSLAELYRRTKKTMDKTAQPFEFIIVDDGSMDNTFEVIKQLAEEYDNVSAVRHFRNHGKSLALMQGFEVATGDALVTMDADLQDQPESIPDLIGLLNDGYEFVSGWRDQRQDSWPKRFLSTAFNAVVARFFKVKLHDVNCGMKAYTQPVYESLELRGDMHRLIPILVNMRGFRVGEVSVGHQPRKHGKSKYPLLRHRGILDIISLSAISATQIRPFHFFAEVSFLFWLLAIISLCIWLFNGQSPGSEGESWFTQVSFLIGAWAAMVGTILPLFGFFLEVEAHRTQDREWRNNLIKERIGSMDGEGSGA